MGFGLAGWKSAVQSVAQTIAQLVGQDIVAKSLTTTIATTALTMNGTGSRITFDTTQFILSNGTTGRLLSTGGYGAPNYALGTSGTAGNLFASSTAPTVVAGAGASVTNNNGTIAFTIGLGGAASTGTVTLPSATTGWVLYMQNVTHPDANVMGQTGFTQTTATFTNYIRTTGVAGNWSANDVAVCIAMAF